jgi:hypothetical protein
VHSRPMSLNGYSWVEGNVINMVDPSGAIASGQCWQTCYDNPCTFPIAGDSCRAEGGELSNQFFRCMENCLDYTSSGQANLAMALNSSCMNPQTFNSDTTVIRLRYVRPCGTVLPLF